MNELCQVFAKEERSMSFTTLGPLPVTQNPRMLEEESSAEFESTEEEETEEEETEEESEDESDDEEKVIQKPAGRAQLLLPPAQFRSGRSILHGTQLSVQRGWDPKQPKPFHPADTGTLVGGLRVLPPQNAVSGPMKMPILNDSDSPRRGFLPPLQKSNSAASILPPVYQLQVSRSHRLKSISRSTPNLLALSRLPPTQTPSPEIEEEPATPIAESNAPARRGSDDDFDSAWIHALGKGKANSSSSLASLFKIAGGSPDQEDEFAQKELRAVGDVSLVGECRSFCASKRTFLQLHPRCLCGDRKKSDNHVKMHACRACGERFNALSNGHDQPPKCVVHSGQVRKFGPGKYVWTCCMDKPRPASSVQEFLMHNVPHEGHHI